MHIFCFPIFSLDHVPFKEFLFYPKPHYFEPAEYLTDIKSPPDWEIIFHKESLKGQEKESSYSSLKDLEIMRMNSNFKSKLDPTQLAAVELALKNKLVLIQVMVNNFHPPNIHYYLVICKIFAIPFFHRAL